MGMNKKMKIYGLCMLIIMGLVVSACSADAQVATEMSRPETKEGAAGNMQSAKAAEAVRVEVEAVELTDMSIELKTLGISKPSYEVTLGADVSATVVDILVAVGDRVTAGQTLYILDDSDTRVNSNNNILLASNTLEAAQNSYDVALESYREMKVLYEAGAVSEDDFESAANSLESAKVTLEGKQISYNNELSDSSMSLGDLVVKAPCDGMVSEINIVEGDKSGSSDMTLVDLETMAIETMVSGNVVSELKLNDPVKVVYNDQSYEGWISRIDLTGTNGTDSFGVEVSIDNAECNLKSGYRVDLSFEVGKVADQVVLDKRAVQTDAYGDYLFLVEDGKAIKTYVEQGVTTNGRVQIIGDLEVGDAVIINGQNLVSDQGLVIIS